MSLDERSEYAKVMDDFYSRADKLGKDQMDTAWLSIEGIWWPNPHYKGEPIANPDDPSGRETNPRTTPSLREKYEALTNG